VELKTAPNPIDSAGPVKQVLSNLFYGWGYNFYRRENQLRADDLLIRGKLSELLGECRKHANELAASFRRERLPAPSREHPFPDPAALATAQALQRAAQQIESLETEIRTAPVPEMDRIHQRHRIEGATLGQLVDVDGRLVLAVVTLRDAATALQDGATAAAELTRLLGASEIHTLWEQREQILSVLR
jgi:hypothetical protein